VALHKRARRHLRRPAGANATVGAAPDRDDRRDSDVAISIVRSMAGQMTKAGGVLASAQTMPPVR
jgi:hypothetical protein